MTYPSLIQKDLPLATWALDDSTRTANASVLCDNFSKRNGTYVTAVSDTSKFPIIHGSQQSVKIPSTSTGGTTYVQVPSLDRFSAITKNDSASLEFWIKFSSDPFTSPTTMTKIVGKPNSQTGVYIHNSSIIGIVGDSFGNIVKASVNIPEVNKTMHVVLSYSNNSVSISVNGRIASSSPLLDSNVFSTYSSSNEYFNFVSLPTAQGSYVLDHIAIYSRALDIPTIRRHFVYGLGYEISNQVASNFGGIRYNFSTVQTPINAIVQKGNNATWNSAYTMSNVSIKDGYLRIADKPLPELKYAKDKTSSVFSYSNESSEDYLSAAVGGYVELDNPQYLSGNNTSGFAFSFYRPSGATALSNGTQATLAYIENSLDTSRYVRFYVEGGSSQELIKVDVDGTVSTLLTVATKLSGKFAIGYYYEITEEKLYLYAGISGSTTTGSGVQSPSNIAFYSGKVRLLSSPAYSDTEDYSSITNGDDSHFLGGIQKVNDIRTKPTTTDLGTIFTGLNSTSDGTDITSNYVATVNTTQKRFIISANGTYSFNVDMKQMVGASGILGHHRWSWGHGGQEVRAKVLGYQDGSNWLAETSISNNGGIASIIGDAASTSKALRFTFIINSNDVKENPTKIFYFRFISYPTTLSGSTYSTRLVCDGPDVVIEGTTSRMSILPSNYETPFLYDSNYGGLQVSNYAKITYDQAALSDSTSNVGIYSLSFFVNIPDSNRKIISITNGTTTNDLSFTASSDTLSGTGLATGGIYVNGSAGTTMTPGEWNHVVIVFSSRLASTSNLTITIGDGASVTNIDELMVFDEALTSTQVATLFNLYKGTNSVSIGDSSTNKITIYDSSISNSTNIYQPISPQDSVLEPINFVSTRAYTLTSVSGNDYSIPYLTTKDIVFDGMIIQNGDKVLLKNQSTASQNGIYTVGAVTKKSGSTIVNKAYLTKDTTPTLNDMVYVKEGIQNEGAFYIQSATNTWTKTYVMEKVVGYSLAKEPIIIKVSSTIEA